MELRRRLEDGDPAARTDAWSGRVDLGRLAE